MNSAFRSGSSPYHRCARPVMRCSRSIKHWRNKKRDVKINVGTHARPNIFFSSVFNIQIRIHIPYFYAVLCCALVLASLFICSFVLPSPFSFGNFYHLPFKKYFSLGKKRNIIWYANVDDDDDMREIQYEYYVGWCCAVKMLELN